MPVEQLLNGVLLPAVAAGMVLLCGWRLWRRDRSLRGRADWAAIGVGLAVVLGCLLRFGLELPPRQAAGRVVWAALAGALFGALEGAVGGRWRWVLRVVFTAAVLRFVLAYKFAQWGELDGWRVVGLLALVAGAGWWAWERAFDGLGDRAGAFLLWLACSATAGMLLFAYNAKLAETLGTAAAGLGALLVAALLRPHGRVAGALAVVVPVATCASALAWQQALADFHPAFFLIPLLAPLLALGLAPVMKERTRGVRTAVGLAAVIVPVVIALAVAWGAYEPLDYGY